MADYRLRVLDDAAGQRQLSVDTRAVATSSWLVLQQWRTVRSRRRRGSLSFLNELAADVAQHGWKLDPAIISAAKEDSSCWPLVPADWRTILTEATQARREAAEHAAAIDRAWQSLVTDIPRAELPVTEIAAIVGLTRVRVHTIRRDGEAKSGQDTAAGTGSTTVSKGRKR